MAIFTTANGEFGDLTLENTAQGVRLAIIKDGVTVATSLLSAADTAQLALLDNISSPQNYDIEIASKNANGSPLVIHYYTGGLAGTLVKTQTITYDVDGDLATMVWS